MSKTVMMRVFCLFLFKKHYQLSPWYVITCDYRRLWFALNKSIQAYVDYSFSTLGSSLTANSPEQKGKLQWPNGGRKPDLRRRVQKQKGLLSYVTVNNYWQMAGYLLGNCEKTHLRYHQGSVYWYIIIIIKMFIKMATVQRTNMPISKCEHWKTITFRLFIPIFMKNVILRCSESGTELLSKYVKLLESLLH